MNTSYTVRFFLGLNIYHTPVDPVVVLVLLEVCLSNILAYVCNETVGPNVTERWTKKVASITQKHRSF